MLSDLARRSSASGRAVCLIVVVAGCGEAIKTPFFDERGSTQVGTGGSVQGGVSGTGAGGTNGGSVAAGGDAGTVTGGTVTGGDAGMAGLTGSGGSAAMAGTGSGGDPVGGLGGGGVAGASGASAGGAGAGATNTGGTGGSVDCSGIGGSAVAFESHCYVLRATPRTWAAARDDCASDGGHLVTISSQGRTEEQFLAENAFVWMLGGAAEKWIGATDGRPSNQNGNGMPYAWITGETMAHDLWSSGQPNNAQTACMENAPCTCGDTCWEHCGFLWDPDNDEPGTWNDRHCEHQIAYVCEWDEAPR